MPLDLKDAIKRIDENDKKVIFLFFVCAFNIKKIFFEILQHEIIWVSCEGENPADIENLGPIQYYPTRGFPGYYFPFLNQKGYLPPILAINFERPKRKFFN